MPQGQKAKQTSAHGVTGVKGSSQYAGKSKVIFEEEKRSMAGASSSNDTSVRSANSTETAPCILQTAEVKTAAIKVGIGIDTATVTSGGSATTRKRGRPRKNLAGQSPEVGGKDETASKQPKLMDKSCNSKNTCAITVIQHEGPLEKGTELKQLNLEVSEKQDDRLQKALVSDGLVPQNSAVFRNQNIPAVKSHSPDQAEPVHTEVNMCKDAFTPRRSGRGVVPNRRFQDMEVDFGRRKIKEDMPDDKKLGKLKYKAQGGDSVTCKPERSTLAKIEEDFSMPRNVKAVNKRKLAVSSKAVQDTSVLTDSKSVRQNSERSETLSSPSKAKESTLEQKLGLLYVQVSKKSAQGISLLSRSSEKSNTLLQSSDLNNTEDDRVSHSVQLTSPAQISLLKTNQNILITRTLGDATDVPLVKDKTLTSVSPGRVVEKIGEDSHLSPDSFPGAAKISIQPREMRQSSSAKSDQVVSPGVGQIIVTEKNVPEKDDLLMSYMTVDHSKTIPVIIAELHKNAVESVEDVVETVNPVQRLPPLPSSQCTAAEQTKGMQSYKGASGVSTSASLQQVVSEEAHGAETACGELQLLSQPSEDSQTHIVMLSGDSAAQSVVVKQQGNLPKESVEVTDMSEPHQGPRVQEEVVNICSVETDIALPEHSDMTGQSSPSENQHTQQEEKITIAAAAEKDEATNVQAVSSTDKVNENGSTFTNAPFTGKPSVTRENSSPLATSSYTDRKGISSIITLGSSQNKFSTSGTQTPYHRKSPAEGSVITIRVQPPSISSLSRPDDPLSLKKEKEEMEPVEVVVRDDGQEESSSGGSGDVTEVRERYIVVNLPEGSTVKQHIIPSRDRLEDDPSYYSVDEAGVFTCVTCDYKTTKKANFYKHKRKHLGIRPHKCGVCNYSAATSSNLKRHMAIHADLRNYKCSICSLNFRQKIHLERHIKYRHEEKKVKCPLCDYICANENPDLKVHLKRKHASQGDGTGAAAAFTCKECGIVAMSKRDLRQHAKFHTKGPELKLFCQMCSFVTDCESRLRRHMFIHTKEKPFQCGMCDYRGSQKEHVLRHMRSVHNIEIVRKHRPRKEGLTHRVGGEGETSGQRPLDKADYSSDEKIFACNHCTMKFAKLINLYKHLHTQHRDIMPAEQGSTFSCVVCDFRTSSKKNLLVHMRKHNTTDQSPPSHVYSCVLCRYMNPKRRNLFQHMRKKHHIEIILRDDGTTTCFVTNDTFSSTSVSTLQLQNPSNDVSDLVLGEVITTVSQTGSSRDDGSLETGNSAASLPAIVKMEDLAMVVSNPETAGVEGPLIVDAGPEVVEGLSAQSLSQHEAAEAIQGLQALAQHRVVETDTLVEEQVQVMGSDEQNTLVIDPSTLGVVEQLVTPKTEPLEVVEIEESQLLEDVTEATTISEDDAAMLGVPPSTISTLTEEAPDGLQLSAEQLMSLTTGDYLEINGEMYKVEVSMEENTTGSMLTHQVINILPSV